MERIASGPYWIIAGCLNIYYILRINLRPGAWGRNPTAAALPALGPGRSGPGRRGGDRFALLANRKEGAHMTTVDTAPASNFIRNLIMEDLKAGQKPGPGGHPLSARTQRLSAYRPCQVHLPQLRSGPGIRAALCNLRFDDTNPTKEEVEYVESIKEDVRWLGFDWQRPALLCLRLFRAALRLRRRT